MLVTVLGVLVCGKPSRNLKRAQTRRGPSSTATSAPWYPDEDVRAAHLIAATNEPEAWLLISLSTVDGLGTVGCYRRSSSRSRAVTSLVTRLGGTGWSTGKCR